MISTPGPGMVARGAEEEFMAATVSARPRISVIVPTYNGSASLARTLDCLVAQSLERDAFEVIVTDDGSSDDSAQVAGSFAPRLRLRYQFQEDLGYRAGAARNGGAMLASAPVLAFLDTGTLAGPDFLRAHLDAHAGDTPRVVVGYTYGYQKSLVTPGLAGAIDASTPAELVARFRGHPAFRDMRHEELEKVGFDLGRLFLPWIFLWSMNMSVAARDFWAAGGFDEGFRGWGAEDLELGFRLERLGAPTRMSREAWAIEPPAERDDAANMKSNARNMLRFLDKWPEPAVELTWALIEQDAGFAFEDEYRALLAWTAESRSLRVSEEIERAVAGAAASRVCVIGCGAGIPDCVAPGAVLADFDQELLSQALADGRHAGRHAIGVRLAATADQSADLVVITSRLRGLWPRWGDMLLAEARRVGREVRGPLAAGPARPA
jgi:validoxylamine A glucosyltransferase